MNVKKMLPLGGFYHFGYVTRDLDAAIEILSNGFGVKRYRRKFNAPWLEVLHAWTGDVQIEVAQLHEGAPQFYLDDVPERPGEMRLHHLGRRLRRQEEWHALENAVAAAELATPLNVVMMDGHLRAIFVDTRALFGHYSEYLFFSGPALSLGDDIPRND